MAEERKVLSNLEIIDTAYSSGGVAKVLSSSGKKLVIFIPKTVEGDIVSAQVVEEKGSFWNANLLEILKPSDLRVRPICNHYDACGGCSYMHISYEAQLQIKEKILKNLFRKVSPFEVEIVFADNLHYRLRISLHAKNGEVGFYAPKSHEIIAVDNCLIVKETLFKRIQTFVRELNFTGDIYAIENEEGEALAEITPKNGFNASLLEVNNVAKKYFQGYLYDNKPFGKENAFYLVNRLNVPFSRNSFFQANRHLLGKLQTIAVKLAEDLRDMFKVNKVLELYAGAGFFTSLLIEQGFNVYACEASFDACSMASCKIENIDSSKFIYNYIKNNYPELASNFKKKEKRKISNRVLNNALNNNEIIFMDPPRQGIEKNIIDNLLLLNPCGIIYISCNPTTLARDVELLSSGGYNVKKCFLVDMYPHTYHIETVLLLIK